MMLMTNVMKTATGLGVGRVGLCRVGLCTRGVAIAADRLLPKVCE